MKDILSQFKNPPKEFRGKPFWSLNGKLEKEELLRQINVMKQMGFGGFFIHSRTGLQTEYLGEEWFSFVEDCCVEAKRLDMEVWLYDEDRWPSGSAGGLVTMKPEFRQKFIGMDILKKDEFDLIHYGQEHLASFAVNIQNELLLDYYPVTNHLEVKDGYEVLVFKVTEMAPDGFYNGYTYLDPLMKEATEYFIELTHEKYKKYCGHRFGKEILGIFTDEPHRGALLCGVALNNEEKFTMIPYTNKLFEVFGEQFGYDLKEHLPEIYYKKSSEKVSKIAWHYVECLQQLFLDNFAKPYYDWCKKNNLIVTGHILHEDNLSIQTGVSGSMMRYYEYMDYPGVDILTEINKNFWVVKQCSSVARQLNKKFVLSELYGCTGWQFNFQSHKTVGDWQTALGINFRCHHLSWYTMEGEAKRDYPASILHQSTYYEDYSYVEEYFSRLGYVMSLGKTVCDVLVINPVESVWSLVHKGWMRGFEILDADVLEIEKKYIALFGLLTNSNISFDYADEDILKRHYRIEQREGETVLIVGQAQYKKIVVGGMLTIRKSTVEILKEFALLGGKVIFSGEEPKYIDCERLEMPKSLLDLSVQIPFDKKQLEKECKGRFHISVKDESGSEIETFICTVVSYEEEFFLLIVNTDRETDFGNVTITVDEAFSVEEWNARNGEVVGAEFVNIEDKTVISTKIFKGTEKLYRLTKKAVKESINEEVAPLRSVSLEGAFDYELNEKNVCVLDVGNYSIDNSEGSELKEILKIDREIRNKFQVPLRGGDMIQPWFRNKFFRSNVESFCKLKIDFPFYIEKMPNALELVLETPEQFAIFVNEQPLNGEFLGKWIDNCFHRFAINLQLLKKGENIITIKTDFNQNTNLEALYLLGDIGVCLEGTKKTLVSLPKKLTFGDVTTQALPFYSGKIRYKTNISNVKARVKLSDCYGALVKAISGEKESVIAFSPFESEVIEIKEPLEIELISTRRNTFGPLHLTTVTNEWYGPYEFNSDGWRFSLEYKLMKNGILEAPMIEIFE